MMKRAKTITFALLLAVLGLSACRRELWVHKERFKQIMLDVDWRNYFRDDQLYPNMPDPDGMTVWFFPQEGPSLSFTTTDVRQFETYLTKGPYQALVVDYSPQEYSHQEFVGMDYASTAKVQSVSYPYQADDLPELYGPEAYAKALPKEGNYCIISWQPENMACDTESFTAHTGEYDTYIPYQERDTYQETLTQQIVEMEPLIVPWRMRVRIYIKGIYYLYETKASIAGLADGYYFMNDRTSSSPCLMALDDWEVHVTGDNVGYIAKTFMTWGVQNTATLYQGRHLAIGEKAEDVPEDYSSHPADEIRLNLRFLLRDRQTVCNYHFDVGNMVRAFWNEYALRIDLMDGFEGQPELPFVEAYNGVGVGGIVDPWQDEDPIEVDM